MVVPKGVDYEQFFKDCQEKGIHITSRYMGVSFSLTNGTKPTWLVRAQVNGKSVYLGRFPFTAQGELRAGVRYLEYLKKHGLEPRYIAKRKYKIKTSGKVSTH
jgi:hypothetical protein